MENTLRLTNRPQFDPGFWCVLLISGFLRILGIARRPIWYDEAMAILRARVGIDGIFQGILRQDPSGIVADQHPPGFFLGLWAWIEVFGESVAAARLFSILFGLLAIAVIYLISREFLGNKKAWIPAIFLAFSPLHIHYSQEIRMYSLMTAMLAIATYAMLKGIQKTKWYWWTLFSIASAGAQYSHHLAGLYLVCLALIPVLKRNWPAAKNTFLAGLGAILLFSPWLIHLPNQVASTHVYWIEKPAPSRLLALLLTYFSGNTTVNKLIAISLFSILIALVFSVIISLRILKKEEEKSSKQGLWAAFLAFLPPLVLWGISQFWPIYIERALLPSAVFFSVWIGWIISHKLSTNFEKGIITGLMVLGSMLGLWTHLTDTSFPYAQWEEIGDLLIERLETNEVVVHSNKLSFVPMFYYDADKLPLRFVADLEGGNLDTLRLPTQEAIGFRESNSIEAAAKGASGLWFIIFEKAILEANDLGMETHPDILWLDHHLSLQEKIQFGELWIMHYSAHP